MKLMTMLLTVFCTAAAASAQTAAPPTSEPDVAIFASVTARELRFDAAPSVRVEVTGSVNGRPADVVSRTDRQNLPEAVQPYVTYRDIGIRLTITSTLPNIEEILDEALGAVPPADAPAEATTTSPAARPRRRTQAAAKSKR